MNNAMWAISIREDDLITNHIIYSSEDFNTFFSYLDRTQFSPEDMVYSYSWQLKYAVKSLENVSRTV